jgi:hypothetical protein
MDAKWQNGTTTDARCSSMFGNSVHRDTQTTKAGITESPVGHRLTRDLSSGCGLQVHCRQSSCINGAVQEPCSETIHVHRWGGGGAVLCDRKALMAPRFLINAFRTRYTHLSQLGQLGVIHSEKPARESAQGGTTRQRSTSSTIRTSCSTRCPGNNDTKPIRKLPSG